MALDITAKITCDMCGRTEERPLRESMRHGRFSSDAPSLVREFPHWQLLGRDGLPVTDDRVADGRVLCEGCARRYRETLERQRREVDELFS